MKNYSNLPFDTKKTLSKKRVSRIFDKKINVLNNNFKTLVSSLYSNIQLYQQFMN